MHASQVVGLVQSGGVHSDVTMGHLLAEPDLPHWVTPRVVDASRKAASCASRMRFTDLVGEFSARASWSAEHIIAEYTPISDQGRYNSCVANATVDLLEILRGLENPGAVQQLSRMFLWWLCRWEQGTPGQNIGTQNQIAMYELATFGICPEVIYPYTTENAYDEPTLDCFIVSRVNRLTAFAPVESYGKERVDQLELSVRANHPFLFSTGVGSAFSNWSAGDVALRPEEEIDGLHDLIGVGVRQTYPDREFWIRNSYGVDYGEGGHCWMHESYLTAQYTGGIYVGTRMPVLRLG